jgi:hypothetical protein
LKAGIGRPFPSFAEYVQKITVNAVKEDPEQIVTGWIEPSNLVIEVKRKVG